jgi:chemotaxis protein MotA
MFQIIGIVVLFACVFGSFIMSGGNIAVVLGALPFELLTIGGAGIAALLSANSIPVLKAVGAGMGKVFKGAKWKASDSATCSPCSSC